MSIFLYIITTHGRVCVCICVCVHMSVYICVHNTHTYTCTHTHAHTQSKACSCCLHGHAYPAKLGCLCNELALRVTPGDRTSAPQGGCTCLKDDGVGTQSPTRAFNHSETCICFPNYCQVSINTAGWTEAM